MHTLIVSIKSNTIPIKSITFSIVFWAGFYCFFQQGGSPFAASLKSTRQASCFIWDETFCAEFKRRIHIWNWWIRRDSKGQKNIFNYKLLEKRASEMDSLLEEPYKPITQMCYKNLRWADWHKMHAFVPIFQKSREPLFYLEI